MTAIDLRFTHENDDGSAVVGYSGTFFRSPRSLFAELIGIAHNATQELVAVQEREHDGRPTFLFGSLALPSLASFNRLVSRFESLGPLGQRQVRDDGSVRAKRWLASRVLGSKWDQAISLVEFDAGQDETDFVAHEHAGRLVIVLAGRGFLYVCENTIEECERQGIDGTCSQDLEPGSAFLLTRGVVHGISGHKEEPLHLLVCHAPFIDSEDDRFVTMARRGEAPSVRNIQAVFRDKRLLMTIRLVAVEFRSTSELCAMMHQDKDTIESLVARLEELHMVSRREDGEWDLHPTVSLEEKDGEIEIVIEDGVDGVRERHRCVI